MTARTVDSRFDYAIDEGVVFVSVFPDASGASVILWPLDSNSRQTIAHASSPDEVNVVVTDDGGYVHVNAERVTVISLPVSVCSKCHGRTLTWHVTRGKVRCTSCVKRTPCAGPACPICNQ